MTINIFQRRRAVAELSTQKGHQTLNQIAQALDISQTSAWRHQTARQSLADTPVSDFWSSAAGMTYLIRVVVAVFYCFGIKHGVGAESLGEFFRMIELERHLATSPSALRTFKARLIESIGQYGNEQLATLDGPKDKEIIVGGDETFFDLPILVFMELASGYIFFEIAKATRSFESWREECNGIELPEGWRIRGMVSDGAKALVKLAVDHLQCVHLPDVFHVLRDLSKPWVSALGRERSRLERAAKDLAKRKDKRRSAKHQAAYDAQVQHHQEQCESLAKAQNDYQQAINAITTALHPFNHNTGEWQLWTDWEAQLHEPLKQLQGLAKRLNLSKGETEIETFRAHLPSIAQGLSLWWQSVVDALAQTSQDPQMQAWVVSALLPSVYWHQQAQKTRTLSIKTIYREAAQQADNTLKTHPLSTQLTPEVYQDWLRWAHQQCTRFQRTSSAIEGRNGQLSRLYQATRGLSPELLNALTIIHNFDTRRADGSTPAERLFEQSFPCLFESLVEQITELPLPRKSEKSQKPQLLPILDFPA
ncbi:MAG: DUF6399 domain-containing protein [Cyanobacteria bacterium P01_G01_bin.54]